MFLFKKTKPTLRSLIPQGYIDIHSHIVPGIDDGAKNSSDSTFLLSKMKEFGFAEAIATPHIIQGIWENTFESIQNTYDANTDIWDASGLKVAAAAEYMMDSEFDKLFKTEKLRTLKDNYVLVEMSYINPPIQLYEILFDLRISGYQPVLAHPERYVFYHKEIKEYKKLINAGCLLQLNLLSLTGYYGKEAAKVADSLLQNGMYSFSGSDIHHNNHIKNFESKLVYSDAKLVSNLLEKNNFFKQ
ncbi:MAG: protein-tyrosine phosphatase [Flavobacterium sp.]